MLDSYDVIVAGGGAAGLCASLSAAQRGCRVLLVDRGSSAERGGNTNFSMGAIRVAYDSVESVLPAFDGVDASAIAMASGWESYPPTAYVRDLMNATDGRCDPVLAEALAMESLPAVIWMHEQGVPVVPYCRRGSGPTFTGGFTVDVAGGGRGIVDGLTTACLANGVELAYSARCVDLHRDAGGITAVAVELPDGVRTIGARAVVLACGGFQANSAWRTQYLGAGWELAKVRGSRFDTGDGIALALAAGALPWGHWSGCHAVAWAHEAPDAANLAQSSGGHSPFHRLSYPFGVIVNVEGERFLDEGAGVADSTYSRYGRLVLSQPRHTAWQIYDASTSPLLRDEYRADTARRVVADTLGGLAVALPGMDRHRFIETVAEFNAAVRDDRPFDPDVLDGRSTIGLAIPKSNWACRLEQPPFEAYRVTCGITSTFGGVRITPDAEVVAAEGGIVPGLFAAGEMVGGLFYFSYPGGSGLAAASVFGRRAGVAAAALSQRGGSR
ncbi:MAG: FAD-dependent tricarballylate dehydrogenase TcuA [Ilumatobacteraceae bacterium]